MKKSLLLLAAFIVLAVGNFENVFAQSQTVSKGSTYQYTYTRTVAGSTVTFVVTGGPGAGSPTDFTISAPDNVATINWINSSATQYTITVTETNGGACTATTTYTVLVNAGRTITFANATPTPAGLCSNPGANYTTTLNFGSSIPSADLPATIPVNITVDGGAPVSVNATLTGIGAAPYTSATLTIPNALNDFEANTSGITPKADQTKVITLTATTDAKGGTLSVGAQASHTVIIYAVPTASAINPN